MCFYGPLKPHACAPDTFQFVLFETTQQKMSYSWEHIEVGELIEAGYKQFWIEAILVVLGEI